MRWSRITGLLASFSLALAFGAAPTFAREELNLLTWCDHTDEALLKPFETANDVHINVKVYELTGAAVSLLKGSNPGDWDVFVVDSADVLRFAREGKLMPLNKADFPYADFFQGATTPNLHESDGKLWAVPEKFGFNTISYDNRVIGNKGPIALKDLFKPDLKGRIAVYDYYLPIIKSLGLMEGIKPADFTGADLERIKSDLFALKKQAAVVGDITTTQNALSSGDAVALLGQGEWVMGVKRDKPQLDWTIQTEGGLRWSQSVAVFAESTKKPMALRFAQYLMSPNGQAAVATASCYQAMPVNSKAVLTPDQKQAMRFSEMNTLLANSYDYGSVSPELDAKMNDLWTEFLSK